ncbi:MAG: hypothetical protein KDC84_01785 [Crocinitomicaceae bacterium]|nr:hypothetical protein [Crocinitomicaceae bacterium]
MENRVYFYAIKSGLLAGAINGVFLSLHLMYFFPFGFLIHYLMLFLTPIVLVPILQSGLIRNYQVKERMYLIGLGVLGLFLALFTYYFIPSLLEVGFDGKSLALFIRIGFHLTWSGLLYSAIVAHLLLAREEKKKEYGVNEDLLDD